MGHRRWAAATIVLAGASGLLYLIAARSAPSGPRGGSAAGIAFGAAGTTLIVFAALLGARRKFPAWRVGRASSWLKGHIWLGLLALPLILFHGGFSAGGPLTTLLLVLLAAVTASGLFGLALQQFLPRLMTEQAPLETIYEEIPHVLEQLREEADLRIASVCGDLGLAPPSPAAPAASPPSPAAASAGGSSPVSPAAGPVGPADADPGVSTARHEPLRPPTPEEAAERRARHRAAATTAPVAEAVEGSAPLKDFYLTRGRPYLAPGGRDGELARKESTRALFERLRTLLPPPAHDALDDLAEICEERRQLAVQARLHGWLHGWLLVHAPLTIALLVLTAIHAVWALRY